VPPRGGLLLALLLSSACAREPGDELRIALGTAPLSLDPHLSNESASFAVNSNLYETLVATDAGLALRPGLAISWTNPDDLTLRLELVAGALFHDGSPVTAGDVVASLRRARDDPRSGWRSGLEPIASLEVVSATDVVIRTSRPFPNLLRYLSAIAIVPAARTLPDSPPLATEPVGSGPYRLVSRDADSGSLVFERFDRYRGVAPVVGRVAFRAIPGDEERVQALTSGRVDMIADVPPSAIAQLGKAPGVRVLRAVGLRETFVAFDLRRERTPYASPPRNPFLDLRVRQAFQRAIDSRVLVRDVLLGFGQPATQLAAAGVFGFDPDIKAPAIDVVSARRLLVEAGYPEGFSVTLDAPLGAYPGDVASAYKVAAALAQINVRVSVNTLPKAELWAKLDRGDSSFYMLSWNSLTADMQEIFLFLLRTPDAARGWGADNEGGYSNPEVDRVFLEAGEIMAPTLRLAKLKEGVRLAMADVPWVPLYVQDQVFGLREPFDWVPRSDRRIRVAEVSHR
jgi:peptide/nickel transport system substrate-binding protein